MTPEEMADAICATFKSTEDDRKCCHVVAVAMIRQAIQDEREACAKVLDDAANRLETEGSTPGLHLVPLSYAQDIRNRK